MLLIYLAMIDGQEDKDKFEQIYKTYYKLLFYVANKILKDTHLSEDAVHNTFLKLLENLDKIDQVDCHKTRSLLVVITRNHSINLYNRQKSHPIVPLDENFYGSSEVAVASEASDELTDAILKLPDAYRNTLTLKYVQGYSNKEITIMLDISEANVRKRLERAKKMVLKIMGEGDTFYGHTPD